MLIRALYSRLLITYLLSYLFTFIRVGHCISRCLFLCYSIYFLLRMHIGFCCVIFSFSVLSQQIGWEERLQNDLLCQVRRITLTELDVFSGQAC